MKLYLSYGLLSLPLALIGITFFVYLPKFYSDVVGLELAVISNIILLSRVWDALIDPVMGFVSDQTRSRFGRRQFWIALGLLPLAISFYFIVHPEFAGSSMSMSAWYLGWTLLFFLFWTLVSVPYESLGPELSFQYDERTKLFTYREGFLVFGTLLSGVFPVALETFFPELSFQQRLSILSVVYSGILLFAGGLCFFQVQERKWSSKNISTTGIFRGALDVIKNKPFFVLLAAYTISALGGALPATLILFYVEHVLGSDQGSFFLVLYFFVGLLFLPIWVKLAARYEKKSVWLLSMAINTGAFAGVYFLGQGDLVLYGVLVAFSAIGYGATLAIPPSMQADVIDYDELRHGSRREGQHVGFWSISKKLSAALGAAIAFRVLDITGYVPSGEQNEETLFALRFLYAGLPCICNFVAIGVALMYPLDRRTHEQIRQTIDSRTSAQ